jgi:hypothetical protein
LNQYSLEFSEEAICLIIRASQNLNLGKTEKSITVSESRHRLETVKTTATQLSSMLREWYPYLETEAEDKTLSTLDRLIHNCDVSLNYYKSKKSDGGRPLKSPSLKLFVQLLILTYEEETGNKYIIEESTSYGRQRTNYNFQVNEFVKSILKHVAPDEDPEELLKMARRGPLSLDWSRKMKGNVDESYRKELSRDKRRAAALKKKLVNKGYQLI